MVDACASVVAEHIGARLAITFPYCTERERELYRYIHYILFDRLTQVAAQFAAAA